MAEGALRDSTVDTSRLSRLFTAVLEFTSDSPADAVVPPDERDGADIGSGTGSVTGEVVCHVLPARASEDLACHGNGPRRTTVARRTGRS